MKNLKLCGGSRNEFDVFLIALVFCKSAWDTVYMHVCVYEKDVGMHVNMTHYKHFLSWYSDEEMAKFY